jgi:transposase
MSNFSYFLGIDVSKKSFDACLIDVNKNVIMNEKFSMDNEGFEKLVESLKNVNHDDILVVLESTGIYQVNLFYHLEDNTFNAAIVNPLLIYNFNKSVTLRKTKTDKIDAFRIACFALQNQDSIDMKKKSTPSIRSLSRERDHLSKETAKIKTEIKNHLYILFPELDSQYNVFTKTMLSLLLKAPGAFPIRRMKPIQIDRIFNKTAGNKVQISPKQLIKMAKTSFGIEDKYLQSVLILKIQMLLFIQKQKIELDQQIKKYVDENLSQEFSIVTSIAGVGQTTAEKFLIEIGEDINIFKSHKQLRAFMGMDPSIKQSGSSINVNGKISKKGNSHLRRTMWQMAFAVRKYSPTFKDYYQKKRSEDKKYKQAVIAVANKLIKTLYALLKNNSKFDENYKNQLKVIYS